MLASVDQPDQLEAALADPVVFAVLVAAGIAMLVVAGRELRQVQPRLLVLMGAAFLDMVGLFMVVPLLPFYVKAFGAGATWGGFTLGEGVMTALTMASFTVAQLLSAPWWGRCSDRWGRRPVLLIALLASSAAFLVFGFAESLTVLMLSRVVQGLGGGTTGVIQAYVADVVEPGQRARALGWLSAATNLGVALGPVIGSLAAKVGDHDLLPGGGELILGRAAPGIFAALLCLLNALFAYVYLREPVAVVSRPKSQVRTHEAIARVVAEPRAPASRLLLIYGIAIGASQGANATMILLLGNRFGASEVSIGYLFMYIGALSVLARILLLGRATDRFGELRVSRAGLLALAAGLGLVSIAADIPMLAIAVALLPVGAALTFPCLTSMLSRVVPAGDRGLYMGLQQTFGGVSRLLAPLAYGVAYDHLGTGAPFQLAAVVIGSTLLLGLGLPRIAPNAPEPRQPSRPNG